MPSPNTGKCLPTLFAGTTTKLDQLKAVGVDYGDVTASLEVNGIAIFDASWQTVGEQVTAALRQQPARRRDGER